MKDDIVPSPEKCHTLPKGCQDTPKIEGKFAEVVNWLMLLEVAKGNQGLSKVAKVAKYTKVVNG